MTGVREFFTPDRVLDEAGEGPFARGSAYEREGRVEISHDEPRRVAALVRGAETYHVGLSVASGHPVWFCSCRAASDGSLCKHAVATALALASGGVARPVAPTQTHDEPPPSSPSVRTPVLRPVLTPVPAPDVRAWRKRITSTFAAGGRFIDYRRAPEWAEGVLALLDEVRTLLDAGHADVVVTLAEDAHRRAETALNRIDDSDGWLTDISHRVAEIHREAVARARPAPRLLAERLFALEMGSHTLDTFARAASRYAELLGAEGIARYRELVAAALELRDDGAAWDTYRLQRVRVAVAVAARDADELIDVKRDDLKIPQDFLEIVETLGETGRVDEAIDWGRRGLERYAARWYQTSGLRDRVAELLAGQGREKEVAALYWDAFLVQPTLSTYRQLVERADDPSRRSRDAIAHLEALVRDLRATRADAHPADALIEILDHEGRHDEAWELSVAHGCHHELALRLAKRRERGHPIDAIPVYERDVELQIERRNRTGYRAAVRRLLHIRELADRAERPDVATAVLGRVRAAHRQKRTLIALLDAAGLDDG